MIKEAIKFMKRSKREVLTTDDINSALRLRNVEVCLEWGGAVGLLRRGERGRVLISIIYV